MCGLYSERAACSVLQLDRPAPYRGWLGGCTLGSAGEPWTCPSAQQQTSCSRSPLLSRPMHLNMPCACDAAAGRASRRIDRNPALTGERCGLTHSTRTRASTRASALISPASLATDHATDQQAAASLWPAGRSKRTRLVALLQARPVAVAVELPGFFH